MSSIGCKANLLLISGLVTSKTFLTERNKGSLFSVAKRKKHGTVKGGLPF